MRKIGEFAAIAALIAGGAGPAGAQAFNGASEIVRGDYAKAERDLVGQRALYPDDVDLMLNLAAVYANTGRQAKARLLYQQAAAQPDEQVMLSSHGSAWSRALAAQGMARLGTAVAVR